MNSNISKRLRELERFQQDFLAGAYPQPSPLGPNSISKKHIKAKQITGSMINVSNLEAVKAETGNLTVDGQLNVTTGGSFVSGNQNLIDNGYMGTGGIGIYIEYNAGTPRLQIGNTSGNRITWDGSTLNIVGTLTATTGSIGGWTIGTTDITADAGATGMASSGSWRFWSGSSTPANAEFRVSSTGALFATGATIEGAITATSGELQTLSVTNVLTLSGSGTVRFNGTSNQITTSGIITNSLDANGGTLANLTVDGTLTVGSAIVLSTSGLIRSGQTAYNTGTGWYMDYNAGSPRLSIGNGSTAYMTYSSGTLAVRGRIEFGTGDYLENDLIHFEVTGSEASMIEFRNGSSTYRADYRVWADNTFSNQLILTWNSSTNRSARYQGAVGSSDASTYVLIGTSASGGAQTGYYQISADGNHLWSVDNGQFGMSLFRSNQALSLYGRFYPGSGGTAQAASYLIGDTTAITWEVGTGDHYRIDLGGTAGTEVFEIRNSSNSRLFGIASNGAILIDSDTTNGPLFHSGASGALPSPTRYLEIRDADDNVKYYIPVYDEINPWSA